MINWQSKDGPWLYAVTISSSRFWDYAMSMAASGITVRWLRGKKMASYSDMFDEVSAALQFPWYFGGNSAAFDECMADLSWLPPGPIAICIDDLSLVLAKDSSSEWCELMEQLRGLCQDHAAQGSVYSIRVIVNAGEPQAVGDDKIRSLGIPFLAI